MKALNPSKVKYIVVHCSDTMEGKDFRASDIERWHKERGFETIGYHFVVDLDGLIERGRPLNMEGAHVKGYNNVSIGVCYIGGKDKQGLRVDTRTEAQKWWMKVLLVRLKMKFPNAKIVGHRDLSPDLNGDGVIECSEWNKDCPCFNAEEEYCNLVNKVFQNGYGE